MSEKSTKEKDEEPALLSNSGTTSKKTSKAINMTLAMKKLKDSLKYDKRVDIDEKVCKFFAKTGLPSETVRDPAFIQLIYTLNKDYSPPTPSTVDYELDAIVHKIQSEKRIVDYRKYVQPIAITVDTVKNDGGVFLAFSLHYYNDGTTRENIVKLVKMTSLELDPASVLQEVQSAANQFCSARIRFPSLITSNPVIAQYFHEANIIDRSYECYFTYITNFADEILKIPEFDIALDVLKNFYIGVKNDVEFQERIEQHFTAKKMVFEIPKMNFSKWTDVCEFLTGVLQYHRLIAHVSIRSTNHKMYIDENLYNQLMSLQMILSFLMRGANDLSKSDSYCSEVLPEIVRIRNLITRDLYDDYLKLRLEQIFMRILDPLTQSYNYGVYDLATFLDPRYSFLPEVFSNETWRNLSYFVRDHIMNSNVGLGLSHHDKLAKLDVEMYNFQSIVKKQRPTSHPFNWWKVYSKRFEFLFDAAKTFITPPPCAINAEHYFGDCGKYRNIENKLSFKQFNNNLVIASSLEPFRGRGLFDGNELFGIKQGCLLSIKNIVQTPVPRKKPTVYEELDVPNEENPGIDLSKYLMLPPEKVKEEPLDIDEILEPEVKPEKLEMPEKETIEVKEELIDMKPEEIKIPDTNTPSTSTPKPIFVSTRTDFPEHVDSVKLPVDRRVYIRVPYQRTAMERVLQKATAGEQPTNVKIDYLFPVTSSSSTNNNNPKNIQLKRPQDSTSIESNKLYKRVCTNFETENGVICKERIYPYSTPTSLESVTIGRPQKMRIESENSGNNV